MFLRYLYFFLVISLGFNVCKAHWAYVNLPENLSPLVANKVNSVLTNLELALNSGINGNPKGQAIKAIEEARLAAKNISDLLDPLLDRNRQLKLAAQLDEISNLPLKELSLWAKSCGAMTEQLLKNVNECLTEENKEAIRKSLKNISELVAKYCKDDSSGQSIGARLAKACAEGIDSAIIGYFNSKCRPLGYIVEKSPFPPFLFAIAIGLGFVGGSITLGSKLAAGLFESTASLWRLWRMNQPLILQKMNAGHDYGDCVFGAASSDVVVVKKVASNLDRCNKGILRKKATSLRFPCHILSGDNLSVLTAMKMIANQTKIPVYRLNLASVTTASQPVEVMKRVLDFVKRYKVILFLQMQEQSCANQAVLDELVNFIIVGNSNSFNGACFIDGSRYVPGNIAGLCKKNKIELKAKFFAVK